MKLASVALGALAFFSAGDASAMANGCAELLRGPAVANADIHRFGGGRNTKPTTQVANWMLDFVPRDSANPIQLAVPVVLPVNPSQPQQFGDGVRNSGLFFGPPGVPPFLALLERVPTGGSTLTLRLHRAFPGLERVDRLEVDVEGRRSVVRLETAGIASLVVDCEKLGWNRPEFVESVYFRPAGWHDWFAVQFPQAYVPIATLEQSMAPRYRALPTGQSIFDPLNLRGHAHPEAALRGLPDTLNLGFLFGEATPRVHGAFVDGNGTVFETATGTAVTRYRLPHTEDFAKIIYLAQSGRQLAIETAEGTVSGTGPHQIGEPATAEIIVNSLGDEPLMTFYGFSAPPLGPNGERLSWRQEIPHLYVGTWLRPGMAFVAPRGTFHQHLTHTVGRPIVAQVLTPPRVPSNENPFGFPRR